MIRILLTLALLLIVATTIAAEEDEQETVYVTDVLRLNLYSDAGGQNLIRKLVSGESLIKLEQTDGFFKVRTEKGDEGWVKRFYTVTKPPAKALLPELQAKLAEQQQEIERLKKSPASQPKGMSAELKEDYENKLVKLNEENVQLFNQVEKQRKELQQLKLKLLHADSAPDATEAGSPSSLLPANFTQSALIAIIAAAAGILLGVILGYRIYGNRLKKRFYGFRV